MSPIAAISAAAEATSRPGIVIRRLAYGEALTHSQSFVSIALISSPRKSIWRRQPATVSSSAAGRSWRASQARSPLPKRSVTGERPSNAAGKGRVDLVLGPGALADQRRPPRHPASQFRVGSSGTQTASSISGVEQAGQSTVKAVGLHPRVGGRPRVLGVCDQDPGDMRNDLHDLHRHLVCRVEAFGEELKDGALALPSPAERTSPCSPDRHLAKALVDVQRQRPHLPPPSID